MKFTRRIILCVALIVFGTWISNAQTIPCPAGFICLSQEKANETASRLKELIEARDVIAKFTLERGLAIAERDAANALVKRINEMIALDDRMMLTYEKAMTQMQKIMDMQTALIEKLITRLDKPKSPWKQFLDALKTVAAIVVGISIGRGL